MSANEQPPQRPPNKTTVPPLDEPTPDPQGNGKLNDIELRLLDAGAKAKENLNREADQRFWLRIVAVVVVIAIIAGMACLLSHVAHRIPAHTGNTSSAYLVAAFVSPIVAMSTLAISLLIAAFRGFREGDEKTGLSAAADGARVGIGGS